MKKSQLLDAIHVKEDDPILPELSGAFCYTGNTFTALSPVI